MKSNYKYITELNFSDLNNWSVQYFKQVQFKYNDKYPLAKIGSFLKRNKTTIEIEDDKYYKRATIKVRNGGVFLRDIEIGDKIGTKSQFIIKEGQFLLSKIDARNGAFGVVPNELDNGIITGNFWTFDVDSTKVNPHYLSLIVTTKEFIEFCENASNGATNRHYLQEPLFLDIEVPLPILSIQNKLLEEYNILINLSCQITQKVDKLEKEIERYLLDELGIELNIETKQNKLLSFFYFSDIYDRWDLLAIQNNIFDILSRSRYKTIAISKAYDFISRKWDKKESVFKYIELGAIDPLIGITETKEIETNDAPSRATQIVKTGDLIIGTTRPYLKKFAIVNEKYNDCICSSGFQNIISQKNNLFFLYEYLKTRAGIEQMNYYMTGALYPAITSKDLKRILIPLPPIEKQNEIANHISLIKKEIIKLREEAEKKKVLALTQFENEIFG